MARYCAQVQEHYECVWGIQAETVEFDRGPKSDLPSEFAVLRFPPHTGREMWTYATRCMSQEQDFHPLELHVFSNDRTDELAEVLTAVSHYHRTGSSLNLHHVINIGKAWAKNSLCDFGIISLPYLDGPTLEWGTVGGKKVRFLWLVPINEAERSYARQHGIEALEQRFEESKFAFADPYRESVV